MGVDVVVKSLYHTEHEYLERRELPAPLHI